MNDFNKYLFSPSQLKTMKLNISNVIDYVLCGTCLLAFVGCLILVLSYPVPLLAVISLVLTNAALVCQIWKALLKQRLTNSEE